MFFGWWALWKLNESFLQLDVHSGDKNWNHPFFKFINIFYWAWSIWSLISSFLIHSFSCPETKFHTSSCCSSSICVCVIECLILFCWNLSWFFITSIGNMYSSCWFSGLCHKITQVLFSNYNNKICIFINFKLFDGFL
jgi:hypothetical protein